MINEQKKYVLIYDETRRDILLDIKTTGLRTIKPGSEIHKKLDLMYNEALFEIYKKATNSRLVFGDW